MRPLAARIGHLRGNGARVVACETIDASAQKKLHSDVFGGTEELANLALSIPYL
jgi:hypothetical protein